MSILASQPQPRQRQPYSMVAAARRAASPRANSNVNNARNTRTPDRPTKGRDPADTPRVTQAPATILTAAARRVLLAKLPRVAAKARLVTVAVGVAVAADLAYNVGRCPRLAVVPAKNRSMFLRQR